MSYIDKNLLPDERILFRTRKHWIIFFLPIVWTFFAIPITSYMQANPILTRLSWIPWVLAFLFWAYLWLEYITSDFAITNKRVMMREGFFNRHANEMRLSAISQVNVDQSLLGQMLNYGTVSINAFGAYDAYQLIANAFQFQKTVNVELDKLVK